MMICCRSSLKSLNVMFAVCGFPSRASRVGSDPDSPKHYSVSADLRTVNYSIVQYNIVQYNTVAALLHDAAAPGPGVK